MSNTIIKTEDLRFSYPAAEGVSPVVLDGVDLAIKEGSFVAVLGQAYERYPAAQRRQGVRGRH